jgi:hypothetical protein
MPSIFSEQTLQTSRKIALWSPGLSGASGWNRRQQRARLGDDGRELVGEPRDGEALAAPGRVLDQVALARISSKNDLASWSFASTVSIAIFGAPLRVPVVASLRQDDLQAARP